MSFFCFYVFGLLLETYTSSVFLLLAMHFPRTPWINNRQQNTSVQRFYEFDSGGGAGMGTGNNFRWCRVSIGRLLHISQKHRLNAFNTKICTIINYFSHSICRLYWISENCQRKFLLKLQLLTIEILQASSIPTSHAGIHLDYTVEL